MSRFVISILLIFIPIISLANALAIGFTPNSQVIPPDNPVTNPIELSNDTVKEIYEKAQAITNATGADSVLMQVKPLSMKSAATETDFGNMMLLVVKKPNSSDSDLLNRFNAYYVNTAKATDSPDASVVQAIGRVMISSARDFVSRRIKSLLKIFKMLNPGPSNTPGSSGSSSVAGAAAAATGDASAPATGSARTPVPLILGQQNIDLDQQEPRIILLIPEAVVADSPDVGVAEENVKAAMENGTVVDVKQNRTAKTERILGLYPVSP